MLTLAAFKWSAEDAVWF